eukprot:1451815-Alexandrium_andersonii.AAC.1
MCIRDRGGPKVPNAVALRVALAIVPKQLDDRIANDPTILGQIARSTCKVRMLPLALQRAGLADHPAIVDAWRAGVRGRRRAKEWVMSPKLRKFASGDLPR